MNKTTTAYSADTVAGLEARFGLRVAAALEHSVAHQGHDIGERLRVAREQALERARASRRTQAAVAVAGAPEVVTLGRGVAALGGGHSGDWWGRLAAALPLVVLVLGLLMIEQWQDQAEIAAAADVDAALLSDDLPPDAYSDPGFAEFLHPSP